MKRTTLILCLSLAGMFGGGEASAHHTEADCPLIFSACSIQYWNHTTNVCVNQNEPTTKSCETSSTCLKAAFCDGAGSCDNTSPESFVERSKQNVVCTPAASPCETPSKCEFVGGGTSGGFFDIGGYECGPHRPKSASTVCRPSTGICDAAESCTGDSRACPSNLLASETTLCRSAAGACDVSDFCDGVTKDCLDKFVEAGETCRGMENQCDAGESCDGTSAFCPEDELADAIPCDDGDECTDGDTCSQGQCIGDGIDSCSAEEPDTGPEEDEIPDEGTESDTSEADVDGDSDDLKEDGGGCSVASQSSHAGWLLVFMAAFLWTRRRKLPPIRGASRN